MEGDLDLEINLGESWVHSQAWVHHTHTPPTYTALLSTHPTLAPLELRIPGTRILGTPIGSTPLYPSLTADPMQSTVLAYEA
eukprot:726562-Rhodomonas_salina.1